MRRPSKEAPVRIQPDSPLRGWHWGRYELRRELGRGATGIVFEAVDCESGGVVALKTLAKLDPENLFRLKQEFRALADLEHENFVRFGELACEDGQWFFTMERVEGTTFLQYVRAPIEAVRSKQAGELGFDERRLRRVLAQLVEGLAALHEAGHVHRDVKPSNVLVTTEGRVVLLDFGLMKHVGSDGAMSGTPTYMAPEQLAGERLTPATDWYAVGVMLREALTGGLPFAGNVHEIANAKLAEKPSGEWPKSTAPEDLRALSVALMARDPEARMAIDGIREHLGLRRPSVPVRELFVGRQQELEQLRGALTRARGGPVPVLVLGEPGIGKTALVEKFLSELPGHVVVLRGRGYEQESVPFGEADTLIDALSEYLRGLPDHDVEELIANGVSNAAKMFPVLYRVPVIGRQRTDGQILNPSTLREQSYSELAHIVKALSTTHTLAVFVDDLQWTDGDSMALLSAVFVKSGARCLFVTTLRAGQRVTAEAKSFASEFVTIEMASLSEVESEALSRALGSITDEALRDAVLREAAGHPLFLSELWRAAQTGRLARQSGARLQDVLWARVAQRDASERHFLRMTALAGAPTPYTVIARAAGLDAGECLTRLAGLRAAQLIRIVRIGNDRCVELYHDRIREAVMEHLRARGKAQVAALQLALGRALLGATTEENLPRRIFAIVHHLNAGKTEITDDSQRRRLAELNLLASRQAYRETAFDSALMYARVGIECLPATSGGGTLWRDLHVARFTAEYLTLGRDVARRTFELIKSRAATALVKAPAYHAWIDLDGSDFPGEAVASGREILEELGVAAPRRATKLQVLLEFGLAKLAQKNRPAKRFADAAPLTDARLQCVTQLLVPLVNAAYYCDMNLSLWLFLKVARIAMANGLSETAPFAFAAYGTMLLALTGNRTEAEAFAQLGAELGQRTNRPRIIALTVGLGAGGVLPWVTSLKKSLDLLDIAIRASRVAGDATSEMLNWRMRVEYLAGSGVSLGEVFNDAVRLRERALVYRSQLSLEHAGSLMRYVATLRGTTPSAVDYPSSLSAMAAARAYVYEGEVAYLMGAAVSDMDALLRRLSRVEHTISLNPLRVDAHLLRGLVSARACETLSGVGWLARVIRIVRALRKLLKWAKGCPANFEPHALILRAELLRVLRRDRDASVAYERAICSCRTHGTAKHEAIACELAAAHARACGDASQADRYRLAAVDAYRRWGADAKAAALLASGAREADA